MDQGAEVLVGPQADAGQGLLSQGVQLDALRSVKGWKLTKNHGKTHEKQWKNHGKTMKQPSFLAAEYENDGVSLAKYQD